MFFLILKKLVFPVAGSVAVYMLISDFLNEKRIVHYEISSSTLIAKQASGRERVLADFVRMKAKHLNVFGTYNVLIYQDLTGWLGELRVRNPVVIMSLSEKDAKTVLTAVNSNDF
ncbi:hypothetical protein HJ146_23280 [Vibrio parahaemolyticus]|nr:hypothetical protein [Vibrio parahaemolyticus]